MIVSDVAFNNGSINILVYVEDVPSEDPIWIQPFATARFPEKTKQVFFFDILFLNRHKNSN
jgi:hypothetical protein